MNINDYQQAAHETAIYPADKALDYLIPGLLVEAVELLTAVRYSPKFVGELGDVTWFVVEICGALRIDVSDIYTPPDTALKLQSVATIGYYDAWARRVVSYASGICNLWVKAVRDKGSVLSLEDTTKIHAWLASLLYTVEQLAALHDLTLADVFQANIDKLASRAARGVLTGNGDER